MNDFVQTAAVHELHYDRQMLLCDAIALKLYQVIVINKFAEG